MPGKGHGEMDAPRLNWLKARLDEQPDRPTMIFMHHPPFPTGLQHMDSINCRNAPAMAEILRGRSNIERVACGHHHRSIQIRWAGTIGSVSPSVAHQVVLDLKPHDDATFTMEPPGYHLHLWQPERRPDHPHRLHRPVQRAAPVPARSRLSGVQGQGAAPATHAAKA